MKLKYTALCALLALPGIANAEIKFNGFATIMAAKTMDDDEFIYGFDDDIDFEEGSLVALQGYSDLGEGFSTTVQIVGRGSDDFDPEIEWAYIAYEITDESKVSVGKLRIPFYMYSEYLDVGYAYTWLQTPRAVYSSPFSSYEGIRFDNQTSLGNWDSNFQFYYGSYDDDVIVGGIDASLDLTDILGVSWEMTYDWFTARIGYTESETTLLNDQFRGLKSQLEELGLTDLANDVLLEEDDIEFISAGIGINYNNWALSGEFTTLDTGDNFFGDTDSYYFSVAYSFDTITPYVLYEVSDDSAKSNPALGYGVPLEPLIGGIFASQEADSSAISVGLRWDFHSSAAYKVEYHQFEDDLDSTNDADLLSMSIDLVF